MLEHLIEIRARLIRCLLWWLGAFLCLFYFSNELYGFIAKPLLAYMPQGGGVIAIAVGATIIAPIKLTLLCASLCVFPVFLREVWGFIAPALYQRERRTMLIFMVSGTSLFMLGLLFAYYVVLPLVFRFLIHYIPEDVHFMPDISFYLSFVIKMLFAFGLAFEVPLIIMLLVITELVSCQRLAALRPYMIVLAFVLGMLLTPPDVLSQLLLALPLWLLFEVGLQLAKIWVRKRQIPLVSRRQHHE